MTLSVLTLARGREAHLRNLVLGLTRQSAPPDELVIGVMQVAPYADLPHTEFPVRQIVIGGGADVPLSRARNIAAKAAAGEKLVFLDVDCIPGPTCIADYAACLDAHEAVMMGEVAYLPAGAAAPGWTYDAFDAVGVKHSDRPGPPEKASGPCNDYRCFWSLTFAMHRTLFLDVGGFDERYTGYGGEDTDFGRTLDEMGVPIRWCRGAKVYHQYHPHHMPPVHHLRSVLHNSEVFRSKWGHHTMEHWLRAFRLMGLIERTDAGIRILREPTEADLAFTRQQENEPYASSYRVVRQLQREEEARAAAAAGATAERLVMGQPRGAPERAAAARP